MKFGIYIVFALKSIDRYRSAISPWLLVTGHIRSKFMTKVMYSSCLSFCPKSKNAPHTPNCVIGTNGVRGSNCLLVTAFFFHGTRKPLQIVSEPL